MSRLRCVLAFGVGAVFAALLARGATPGSTSSAWVPGATGLFCGLGAAGLVGLFAWGIGRLRAGPPAPVGLEDGERLLFEVPASHVVGRESRRGSLTVTTRRLLFEPCRFRLRRDPLQLRLDGMEAVRAEARQLVVSAGGREQRFVVTPPDSPAASLEALADGLGRIVQAPESGRAELVVVRED